MLCTSLNVFWNLTFLDWIHLFLYSRKWCFKYKNSAWAASAEGFTNTLQIDLYHLLNHNSRNEFFLSVSLGEIREKKKINGSLCCLGYPSEILRDRRDRILITSSMYCNFRRRIKGFFSAWEERVCGSAHKVAYNSWILIATANRVTICMTTDTVSFEDLFFLSNKSSDGPTTPTHTCTRTHGDICTYATFCFQSHIHTQTHLEPRLGPPPLSEPNKYYHSSMSAHRLIRCLSSCRESALVRYKATQGNLSLNPKHLVWQSERGEGWGGERRYKERWRRKKDEE